MVLAELADVGLFASIERHGDLAIHAAVDLRRAYDKQDLERALEATIADFPVFGRAYEPRFWRDRWRPVDGPLPVFEVDSCDLEAETERWVRTPIDLTQQRPIRVVSLRDGARTRLLFTVMHLAVDGAGAAAVAHVFGSHLHGVPPALPVDQRRSVQSVLERLRWMHLPVLARDVARSLLQPARTFLAAQRERQYPERPAHLAHGQQPAWRWLVVSEEHLARLKARCGTSVNDILVAALAHVAATRSTGGPVAVTYTMDLRRYGERPRLSAANTSSILTAIVPRTGIGDLAQTARAVAKITRGHREGLAGPAFLVAPVLLAAGLPHSLARRLTPWIHPVVVDLPLSRGLLVTNVGRIDHGVAAFGDALEDVRIIGPNLRGIRAPGVIAYGFRGELHLELFSPPNLGNPALDELERELREALELPALPETGPV